MGRKASVNQLNIPKSISNETIRQKKTCTGLFPPFPQYSLNVLYMSEFVRVIDFAIDKRTYLITGISGLLSLAFFFF